MITISLCMIVKNEQEVLSRCLDSVKEIVDEIIIVDTGSTDKTKEIARAYTGKVYDFEWVDDFSAARNHSFSFATEDYIMWMDADDVLLEEDRSKLLLLKENLSPDVDVVMMKYNYGFDGNGNVTLSFYRERLLKRERNFTWSEPIHECIATSGTVETHKICVTHRREHSKSGRNLRIYEKIAAEGKHFSSRSLFYYAKELHENGLYAEAVPYFHRYLDSSEGWIEDKIQACYLLSKCHDAMHDGSSMLKALFRSFEYATPRAEICCQLAWHFMAAQDYRKAIFWYELATRLEKPEGWGFVLDDLWGFVPWIQLCVCYYNIGNIEKAEECNERASGYKPDDPSVLHNRQLFQTVTRPR